MNFKYIFLILFSLFFLFNNILNADYEKLSNKIDYSNNYREIDIYSLKTCPHCIKTFKTLDKFGIEYNEKDLSNEIYIKEIKEIYFKFGVPVSSWGTPTIHIIKGNKSYLIIGELNERNYKNALNCDECYGKFFYSSYFSKKNNTSKKTENPYKISKEDVNSNKLTLLTLILAALADSFNPCTLAIMALLLLHVLRTKSRKMAFLAGIIFSFTIFFVYFLLGLGILKAISLLDPKIIYIILAILALLMFIMEVNAAFFNYKPGFLSLEMPNKLRPYAKKIIKNTNSLWFIFFTALFLSLTLVPCSSGPYLLILGMIGAEDLIEKSIGLIYLIIYNLIFILPMLLITFAVAFGLDPKKIKEKRDKEIRNLHKFSALILFLILLIILYKLLTF